jgi:hypothetical protein
MKQKQKGNAPAWHLKKANKAGHRKFVKNMRKLKLDMIRQGA